MYAVGRQAVITPTQEQSSLLNNSRSLNVFSRLFKNGIIYYST